MEDLVYYNNLYDLYKNLLTDKQQEYFEDYYFNNLSLSEIADNYNISRNAVSKQLSVIKEKLDDYEQKLIAWCNRIASYTVSSYKDVSYDTCIKKKKKYFFND